MGEMSVLEWNDKRTTEKEGKPADLSDACLYAFTACYNYLNPTEKIEKIRTLDQYYKEQEQNLIAARLRQINPPKDALEAFHSSFIDNGDDTEGNF